MDPGLTAATATGAASYAGYGLHLSARGTNSWRSSSIVGLALVNIRGVKLGAWFVRWLTVLKVGFLAFAWPWWAFAFGAR